MVGFGFSIPRVALTPNKGVPEYMTINGVLARLLIGRDGLPLMSRDGQYLYGRV